MKKISNCVCKNQYICKYQSLFIYLFLIGIIISVYWQVSSFEFVGFDDNEYVYDNPRVSSGISIENLTWSFTAFHSNNWHPLTWISYMVDCEFFGLDPGWHHIVNVFFHIANALLLFYVFRKMTGFLWQSAFVAAIFAIHPLHVESVAWVSERKDVLSTFFWFLTMISYYFYVNTPEIKRYFLVFCCFALGLLSKPMLVTLPFVLLLLDYWPLNRIQINHQFFNKFLFLLFEKIPLFILVVVSSLITFNAQQSSGVMKSFEHFSIGSRIANAIVSYWEYIAKTFYPAKMAFLYIHPEKIPLKDVLSAFIFLVIISVIALRISKKYPYFLVGWLWFLGTLVPVIGIVQVGMQSMADRYSYVPMIGLLIIVAWTFPEIFRNKKFSKPILFIVSILFISVLMPITWKQVGLWKDSSTMLLHTLKVTDNNYIAHDTLGVHLFFEGKTDEAIRHFEKALQINPEYHNSHFNLGLASFQKGKIEEAIGHYRAAIQAEPNFAKAYCNLGVAYFQEGKTEQAVGSYFRAIEIKPDYVDALYNAGLSLYHLRRVEEAIQYFGKAIEIDPALADAYYYLGLCWDQKGDLQEAIRNYEQFIKLEPEIAIVHVFLADALVKLKKIDKAISHYKMALSIEPSSFNAHYNLGTVFQKKGNLNKAMHHYLEALRSKPDFAQGYYNLGIVFYKKGKVDGAIECFQTVLKIQPEDVRAQNHLKKIWQLKHLKTKKEQKLLTE